MVHCRGGGRVGSPAIVKELISILASFLDEDGALIDLINADLADEPLTEADKEINAKLLKESQLASERFWNRKGRRHGTTSSPTKATGLKCLI